MHLHDLRDLVIVAGHAALKAHIVTVPRDVIADDAWVLQPFQRGETPLLVEHIRRGTRLAAGNAQALLLFSGGHTSVKAGAWSEGRSYFAVAASQSWWCDDANGPEQMASRADSEEFARDSFENVLFSVCRFQQLTGVYPRTISVVSWRFKQKRFEHHRDALRFPVARFSFIGPNDPPDLAPALTSEAEARQAFLKDPYGSSLPLAAKRASRDPSGRRHTYDQCPGMSAFFTFLGSEAATDGRHFPGVLPWE